MFKQFRLSVIYILVFQISLSPTFSYATPIGNGLETGLPNASAEASRAQSQINLLAENLSSVSTKERQQLSALMSLGDAIENTPLVEAKIPVEDTHLVSNQRIEYYREGKLAGTVLPNNPQLSYQTVGYTRLNVKYDKSSRELIFEATRGENEEGLNGEVVARQILGGMDIVAMSYDKELLVMIDSKGNLSAINYQFVTASVFKSVIPTFRNLWSPLKDLDLSNRKTFINFRTRASTPLLKSAVEKSTVIPLTENAEPIFNAGDILAGYEVNGKVTYLGLFNRAMIAEEIYNQTKFAFEVGTLSQANETLVENLIQKTEKEEQLKTEFENYLIQMSLQERKALAAMTPEALLSLKGTAEFMAQNKDRARDQFTYKENIEWAAKALAQMRSKYPDFATNESGHFSDNRRNLNVRPVSLESLYKPSAASKYISAATNFMGKWYTLAFLGVGYLSFPIAYDHFETLQTWKVLAWSYNHLYTDVMKDASYRLVNIRSQLKLLAIIPAAMLTSASTGWLLKGAARTLKNSNTLFAQRIRDMAATWGDMGVWQRIITFSNRYYSVWVYPVLRIVFSHIMRQKGLFSGLENGFINPLEKVKADSAIGRQLGLTKDESVLFNNPIEASVSLAKYLEPLGVRISPALYKATDAKANAVTERKQKIQSLLKEQKIRYKKLSWAFAALVVSEQSGVDPATLTAAMESGKSLLDIDAILKDETKSKQWELISEELFQSFHEMDLLQADLKTQLDPVQISEMIAKARSIGERIVGSKTAAARATLKMKFRKMGLSLAKGTAQYGMSSVNILRTSIPNNEIFDMIKREFILDHAQVVIIPANVGERADLKKPEELTADANGFLDTNPRHLFEVEFNAYAHLALSGAQNTLTYYVHDPELETAYDPIENTLYKIQERSEPLFKSLVRFGRNLLPDKSNIGGVILKDLGRRLSTIQSQIYVAVFLRGLAYGASPALVLHMFGFQFFSSLLWWGWIWYPMQLGTQMLSRSGRATAEQMQEKILRLSRAIRGLDGADSDANMLKVNLEILSDFQKYSPEMLQQIIKSTASETFTEFAELREQQRAALKQQNLADESLQYFGLLTKYAEALKNRNYELLVNLRQRIQALQQKSLTDEETKQLQRLSSESFLEFAVANPAMTSKPHPLVPWMATQTAVMVSTYLAISWSVVIMNTDLLMAPGLIPKWMALWVTAYTGVYLFLRKDSWSKQAWLNTFESIKEWVVLIKNAAVNSGTIDSAKADLKANYESANDRQLSETEKRLENSTGPFAKEVSLGTGSKIRAAVSAIRCEAVLK